MTTTNVVVADLASAEIDRDLDIARSELARVEAIYESVLEQIDAAVIAEGAAMDAATRHGPLVHAALQEARDGNPMLLTDSQWRAYHPDAARLLNEQDGLGVAVKEAAVRATTLSKQRDDLQWQVLPRLRGAVHVLEEKRNAHVAAQETTRASLADRPGALQRFRRQFLGGA